MCSSVKSLCKVSPKKPVKILADQVFLQIHVYSPHEQQSKCGVCIKVCFQGRYYESPLAQSRKTLGMSYISNKIEDGKNGI